MARNRANMRRIGRAAQARYIDRERHKRAPRSEDVARAIAYVLRNQRGKVMKVANGRDAVLKLLELARDVLIFRGFSKSEVLRKMSHILKPKHMTIAEAEELASSRLREKPAKSDALNSGLPNEENSLSPHYSVISDFDADCPASAPMRQIAGLEEWRVLVSS